MVLVFEEIALLLVFERSRDEGFEQRMGAVRAALEFGVELHADVEITVRQFHSLDQAAVRAGAGDDKTFSCISARKSLLNS